MIVKIEMTEEEAREFLEYRKNRDKYRTLQSRLNIICQRIKDALAPVRGEPGQYEIADQDYADDLWNTAQLFRQ